MARHLLHAALVALLLLPSLVHARPPDPALEKAAKARRGSLQLVTQPQTLVFLDDREGVIGVDANLSLELYKFLPIINPYVMLGLQWSTPRSTPVVALGARPNFVMGDGAGDLYLDVGWGFLPGTRATLWRLGSGWRVWVGDVIGFGMAVHYVSSPDPSRPMAMAVGFDLAWSLGTSMSQDSAPTRRR